LNEFTEEQKLDFQKVIEKELQSKTEGIQISIKKINDSM